MAEAKPTARRVVITCAVTGPIHTPSTSPYLPITLAEIAEARALLGLKGGDQVNF